MKPFRAASLSGAGIASSKFPSTTSTCLMSSGTLARILHMRRDEVDHALQPHRLLDEGSGSAGRESLEEL